jgi:hypothetical protein
MFLGSSMNVESALTSGKNEPSLPQSGATTPSLGQKQSEKHLGCSGGPDAAFAWWLPIASESCRAL